MLLNWSAKTLDQISKEEDRNKQYKKNYNQ